MHVLTYDQSACCCCLTLLYLQVRHIDGKSTEALTLFFLFLFFPYRRAIKSPLTRSDKRKKKWVKQKIEKKYAKAIAKDFCKGRNEKEREKNSAVLGSA
jgi:hypothetical protein